jgi:hypothetical protein
MKQHNGITGTSVLFEYANQDIIIGVEGIPKDESIGIDRMNSYLSVNPSTGAPFWEITQECPKHNWEFKKLAWKTYASAKLNDRNNLLEKVHDKDNHLFDAQKYFFTFMQDLGYIPPVLGKRPSPGSYLDVELQMGRPFTGPVPVSKWDIVESIPVHLDDQVNDYGWSYGD